MFKRLFSSSFDTTELCASRLFDNETFYKVFMRDLVHANHSIYIESPFITTKRMGILLTILKQTRQRGIQITVNTRPPVNTMAVISIRHTKPCRICKVSE